MVDLITKPMLSGTLKDISKLKFPVSATPKLDGIRCLRINGRTVSRKFLDIPNRHIQKMMTILPDWLDGELMIPNGTFNQVQSAVMSEDGEPKFEFHVFDYVKPGTNTLLNTPYYLRMKDLEKMVLPDFCKKVMPVMINNVKELDTYEEKCLSEGYEGIMIRSPDSPYKCGRSTEREGFLLKVKRFEDSEAEVIGFEEQLENTNEAEEDAFGRTKRSKALEGMVGKETLGKFIVREVGDTPWKGKEFFIGTGEGLTEELRQQIWNNRKKYLGKIVTYKFQPHGVKDLPRLPIWKGFRSTGDL